MTQIIGPGGPTTALTPASAKPLDLAWRTGQILEASVVTASTEGEITLNINGAIVKAHSDLSAFVGQRLTLQVAQLSQQQVVLKLVTPPAAAGPTLLETATQQLFREALPRQGGLPPLLSNLTLLAATPSAALPPPVQNAIQRLVALWPDSARLQNGAELKRAVLDSGLFLEAKLAQAVTTGQAPATPLQHDIKAALLTLLQQLDTAMPKAAATPTTAIPATASPPPRLESQPPAPPLRGDAPVAQATVTPTLASDAAPLQVVTELKQQAEGALARLQLAQLASVPTDASPNAQWTLELPVRHGARVDVFDVRIREEATAHGAEAHESRWAMVLGFDLPGLGPTYARVTLHGDQVATTFWAEDPDTVALIAAQLPELRAGYVADGLAVAQLQCFPGQPPSVKSAPSGLLSVRA